MSDSTVAILLGGTALAVSLFACGKMVKHDIKKCVGLAMAGKCAYKIGSDMNLCEKFGFCCGNDKCEDTEECETKGEEEKA